MKKFIKKIFYFLENLIIPTESMEESKKKWNNLARKNYIFPIIPWRADEISIEELYQTGEEDYNKFVATDSILNERLYNLNEKTALDIGCGLGRIKTTLAYNFKTVYGIDISDELIIKAKEFLHDKNNVFLFSTDGIDYPLEDEIFDFIFSFNVFQHMPSYDVVKRNFQETARVLKKGGIAKIQVRGIPARKIQWSYGVWFDLPGVKKILSETKLSLLHCDGEHQKFFWLWLTK